MDLTCDQCGRDFVWEGSGSVPGRGRVPLRCSAACKKVATRARNQSYPRSGSLIDRSWTRRPRVCGVCGVEWANAGHGGPREYCSPQCQNAQRNGKPSPKAWRECHRCGDPVAPLAFTFGWKRVGLPWCGCSERYRPLPLSVRELVWDRDGWTCQLCDGPVDRTDHAGRTIGPFYPTIDHIVPRSAGGTDDLTNLRTAHHRCNQMRGVARGEQLAWAV